MGKIWFYTPTIHGARTTEGRVAHVSCWFELSGAGAITSFSPTIEGVRRLVDGGALPFFRVKLLGPEPLTVPDNFGTITFGIKPSASTAPVGAQDVTDLIVANPVDVRGEDEIDVGVYNALGSDARVDTSGVRVYFNLDWYV